MASSRTRRRDSLAQEGQDEDESLGQRRILRSHYRSLKSAIEKDKDNIGQSDVKKFNLLISSVNTLYNKARRPRELVADAEAVCDITTSLLNHVKSLRRKSGPTSGEFVQAILHKFGNGASNEGDVHINWTSLTREAAPIIPDAPGLCTMLGPMERLIPKKKNERIVSSRKRERPGPSTRPEQVEEFESKAKTETDKNMETMFLVLRRHKKVRLECLLLNRNSFAQTVENLFALSFLVKDGRAQLEQDQQGACLVVPKNAPSGEDRASGKVHNSQFIFRLDFADWKFMQTKVEQGAEVMPNRSRAAPRVSVTPIRKTSRNRARETGGMGFDEDDDGERPRKM